MTDYEITVAMSDTEPPSASFYAVRGAKGDTGETGATPDIQIGTVETLDAGEAATASMTGTAEEPLLNLGIPQGIQGEQGVQGIQGKTGNGIASAALNADYTLTLTFTDGTSYTTPSIRGAQGEQGETGDKGDKGDKGDTYELTEADKQEIIDAVLDVYPAAESEAY